jgi:DnaJ-class molecular chaperone
MPMKHTEPCPDCKGSGNKPRPPSDDPRQKFHETFPMMICDRCGGSGKVPAGKLDPGPNG